MDNYRLAAHLCSDPIVLSRLCTLARGNFFAWSLRQILITKWYDLPISHKEYLLDTLQTVLSERPIVSSGIGDGLLRGYIILPIPQLQSYVEGYKHNNPFTEKVIL